MSSDTKEKGQKKSAGVAPQVTEFRSGNEMASMAAAQVNFHVMGYYPITPSTEVAEYLDEMAANGRHDVKMVPGDGEHGAAGICYGASTAGGRVFNATSANGLLYSIEQMPVQSGTRYPMVLNLVCRSVSGPLDIRGDHSDLVSTLDMGWIVLTAKDPQATYDLTIAAVKIGEAEDVRLPVIVADDGFFTSHQKRRVSLFEDDKDVQDFVGKFNVINSSVDVENPITIGPYMNDPDQINNKKQLSMAMSAAEAVIPKIYEEYKKLSGREYNWLETYNMEDAEVAIFIINSAADTCMDVSDKLREKGIKAGVVYPTAIRPFPADELRKALKNVKAVVVGDRADSYGAHGGRMSHEVKAALKDDLDNRTMVISRIYGLGGKDFFAEDAEGFFTLAADAVKKGSIEVPYDYIGVSPGDPDWKPQKGTPPLTYEIQAPGIVTTSYDEKKKEVIVKGVKQRDLTEMPHRITAGHGACPGCGIFPICRYVFKRDRRIRRHDMAHRLRHGGYHRLPQHLFCHYIHSQPFPEWRGHIIRCCGDVQGKAKKRRDRTGSGHHVYHGYRRRRS